MPRVLAIIVFSLGIVAALAQDRAGPSEADRTAWTTFTSLVAPTSHGIRWDEWATDDDVFLTAPPLWPGSRTDDDGRWAGLGVTAPHERRRGSMPAVGCAVPLAPLAGGFPRGGCIVEETRHNRVSFDYIVDHGLYVRPGLASIARAKAGVDFPDGSVDTKSDWMSVRQLQIWQNHKYTADAVRHLYFTKLFLIHSKLEEFVLLGLHLRVKRQGRWLWATFEHALDPGRCDDIGCRDRFGAVAESVGPRNGGAEGRGSQADQTYGECTKSPAVEVLFGQTGLPDVWSHYCLRGSQVDVVEADGRPSLLGNSVIERINSNVPVSQSSCITCHAHAAFKTDGTPNTVPFRPIGPMDPNAIAGMVGSDFSWAMTKAR